MADPTGTSATTTAAAAAKTLLVESLNANAPASANINVGDVLQVLIRQNSSDGPGLIFFNGMLLRAELPDFLGSGDKITAQVLQNTDRLLLKILDFQKAPEATSSSPAAALLANVEQMLEQTSAFSLRTAPPLEVVQTLKDAAAWEQNLQQLVETNLAPGSLADPQQVLQRLLQSANGSLAPALRDAAQTLRNFVTQNSLPPEARPILILRDEVTKLLSNQTDKSALTARSLEELFADLQFELKDPKKPAGQEKQLLRAVLDDLQTAQQAKEPEQAVRPALEKVLERLTTYADKLPSDRPIDQKLAAQIEQLAARLDQLAGTQDALRTLNPVMQALGEPALILFPFLFQGMLTHSEVIIHPRSGGQKKQQKGAGGGKEKSDNTEPFQRVQVEVPLPALGTVSVDVAHRPNEIFVRLTVDDPDVGQFVSDQMEHLAAVLREQGYEKADLSAAAGPKPSTEPGWFLSVGSVTKIIA